MTNIEKWRFFMRDFESPSSYIDWSFYTMVSSCLQRRVWCGDTVDPIYLNLFTILVGTPATGKGRVIKQIANCLRSFKKIELDPMLKLSEKQIESNYRILFSPDSSTLEAMTEKLAKQTQSYEYKTLDKDGKQVKKIYAHASMTLLLEEMATMFKENTGDLARFLIVGYNCDQYERETKSSGKDYIKRLCLTLLGGTQAETLAKFSSLDLIESGFARRTLFIYEDSPRFYRFEQIISEEQATARQEILSHLEKLFFLYGHATYTPEAKAYFKEWYENPETNPARARINTSPVLDGYYGSKRVHVAKLSACIHFAESTDMVIGVDPIRKAIKMLESIEGNMHKALTTCNDKTTNPLAPVTLKVYDYIVRYGPVPMSKLMEIFILSRLQMTEVLESLKEMNKIKINSKLLVEQVKE